MPYPFHIKLYAFIHEIVCGMSIFTYFELLWINKCYNKYDISQAAPIIESYGYSELTWSKRTIDNNYWIT